MSDYQKEAEHYRDVAQIAVDRHEEMRKKIYQMECERDRAIEIALDCLNGKMGTEEILALAELIKLSQKPIL
jgi:hypothetical protein